MSAILDARDVRQENMANCFRNIAKRYEIDVEFDFTDPMNPQVNFTGGTEEQHVELALELCELFGDYLD
jgi:hypothetical protein